MKQDPVAAFRNLEANGISCAFVQVVLGEAVSQAARVDPHDGVLLAVEVAAPPEVFNTDNGFLQVTIAVGLGVLHEVDQQVQEAVGAGKRATVLQALELRSDCGLRKAATGVARILRVVSSSFYIQIHGASNLFSTHLA